MEAVPAYGLAEYLILAGVAGLCLLTVIAVVGLAVWSGTQKRGASTSAK